MEPDKGGTINDINPKLVNFYVVVRDHVDELIEDAEEHKNEKEYFYKARAEFNEIVRTGFKIPNIRLASLLLYLNKTAFNGLYRENRNGEFNVPFGKYKNPPRIVDEERLRKASGVLKKLDIYNEDFTYILRAAGPEIWFILIPPRITQFQRRPVLPAIRRKISAKKIRNALGMFALNFMREEFTLF